MQSRTYSLSALMTAVSSQSLCSMRSAVLCILSRLKSLYAVLTLQSLCSLDSTASLPYWLYSLYAILTLQSLCILDSAVFMQSLCSCHYSLYTVLTLQSQFSLTHKSLCSLDSAVSFFRLKPTVFMQSRNYSLHFMFKLLNS